MASSTPTYLIPNPNEPSKPFTFINIHNSIKLTPTNYLSWKMQIQAILIGHDLHGFVDGTTTTPPSKITTADAKTPNPAYQTWVRQDKLLLGALVGTLSPSLVPLVSQATTSKDLWEILSKTYAKPSRGHIKQLKDQFNRISKGSRNITEYMQAIKACADQLAILGKSIDQEDLIDRVLSGLDPSYNSIVESVNGRDTPISFEELHEKLINKELFLQQAQPISEFPATAFVANTRNQERSKHRQSWSTAPGLLPTPTFNIYNPHRQRKPYLGKCQWCREQGHIVTKCPIFQQQFPNASPHPPKNNRNTTRPQAHAANLGALPSFVLAS